MDFLTHLFLPLAVLYVLCSEAFQTRWVFLVAGFGLLPDFDKFLGVPGLLHSAITIGGFTLLMLAGEQWWRGRFELSPVVVAFAWSHLILDLIDGGPVPLFAPVSDVGVGLTYPMRVAFGEGTLGISFHGPLVALNSATPRGGFNTYGFIDGAGIASMLAFACIYFGERARRSK
jgi:hypothetical protein